MVEAERRLEGRTTTETRYFISSLPAQDTRLPRAVRRHWRVPSGCENSRHWVLDIAFREDESRIRTGHAAHNMALLRRLALNTIAPGPAGPGWFGCPAQTGGMRPSIPPGTTHPIKCDCPSGPGPSRRPEPLLC